MVGRSDIGSPSIRALIPVLGLAAGFALTVEPAPAMAQQSVRGDCNVQIGSGSSGNSVTLLCLPELGTGASRQPPLILKATVEGLQGGRRSFDVVLRNQSDEQRAAITPAWLSLSDDQGNTYGLDCHAMACVRDTVVPPGQMIRFGVALDRTIDRAASRVFFTLRNVWYASRGTQRLRSLGAVEWSLPVAHGPLDNSDLEVAERAAGMTRIDRQHVQRALNEMGFNAGAEDGQFDDDTRRAIAQWQSAKGLPATGYLDDFQAFELSGVGFASWFDQEMEESRRNSEERRQEWQREHEEFRRRSEEMWRQLDRDFQRPWGSPPPWR